MVAIFTGSGTGLERGSGNVLGGSGLLGSASLGRGGEQLFLNAATGNLIVQHRDEFLTGRGGDLGIGRTYNSLGNMSDDNGDNWRQSTDRAVFGLTGIVSSAGSTVKRRSGDGSEIIYSWNGSVYVATDGAGAFDTLTYGGGNNWTWTDGDSRVTEVYSAHNAIWRIVSEQDASGNVITYSYTGDHLTQVATADGGVVQYSWSGNNIAGIVTSSQGTTLTRTRYGYDTSGRLSTVTVDLSPEDGNIADGQIYTTTYGYEGASLLVSSIAQSDGSSVTLQYDANQRITTMIEKVDDATTRTSTLTYGDGYTTITDAAGQTTRLDYGTDDNFAAPLTTWASVNLLQEPVTLNGRPATRYTVVAPGVTTV
jgi:YD repeat-containing protein